jgi:hypothetical protein
MTIWSEHSARERNGTKCSGAQRSARASGQLVSRASERDGVLARRECHYEPAITGRRKGRRRISDHTAGLTRSIIASGRADWAGSLELQNEPVDDVAMRNTARVIHDLHPDVLAIVEGESRPVLGQFNQKLLKAVGGQPLRHFMVIDGNDIRGIDVGLMTSSLYPIGPMRSHVDDRDGAGEDIFSRDCLEFGVHLPNGNFRSRRHLG